MESTVGTYHHPGSAEPPPGGGSAKQSFIAALLGGAVVAAVFAVLVVTGVVGGETRTVIQQGVAGAKVKDGPVQTVNTIYRKAAPGVVSVKTHVRTGGGGDLFTPQQEGVASGTGVVVDKRGFIVTNAHVVENNEGQPVVQFNDEKSVSARIVGRDPSIDIAVLKVDPKGLDLKPLPLGDSSKLEVGDTVVAIGSPFGLDQTVTTGIVSALQRQIQAPNNFQISNVIQTDAAINPGNSGGPLLDANGEVVGINSQIATSGGSQGNVGIGFAVPIDKVKEVLPQLEKSGKVDYAYLGVSTQSLSPAYASRFNLGGFKQGALVACVVNGGPAAKAGMRAGTDTAVLNGEEFPLGGDLIIKIDGKSVKNSEDVAAIVLTKKPGDSVSVTVVRDGKQRTLTAKLGTRPNDAAQNNCER